MSCFRLNKVLKLHQPEPQNVALFDNMCSYMFFVVGIFKNTSYIYDFYTYESLTLFVSELTQGNIFMDS